MPALPSSVLEPSRVQVAALLPTRQVHHPLGDHLRRRRDEWISAGVAQQLRQAVLTASDRRQGLELEQLLVDSCITKAPGGGQTAGPSPVDRRKQGLKRSLAVEATGIPLATLAAPANRRDAAC